jgi:hypothetical protein
MLRDVLGMTGSGMSECGTSAIVPAIANAIVAATGKPAQDAGRCQRVETTGASRTARAAL